MENSEILSYEYYQNCMSWYIYGELETRSPFLYQGAVKNIFEEPWCGNSRPNEFPRERSEERQKLIKLLSRHGDTLDAMLTEEQKAILDKYRECHTELSCLDECEVFIRGFRLGMRIAIEVLRDGDMTISASE